MRISRLLMAVFVAAGLTACSEQWGNADVKPVTGPNVEVLQPTDPAAVVLTDLEVTANKTTLFNRDPTREDIDRRLRDEAAKLGADAVILIRYGTVGVSLFSWGSLDGQGRAVKFTN